MVWDTFSELVALETKKKKCANFVLCSEQTACNDVCLLGLKRLLFNYPKCVWYYPKSQVSYLEFNLKIFMYGYFLISCIQFLFSIFFSFIFHHNQM